VSSGDPDDLLHRLDPDRAAGRDPATRRAAGEATPAGPTAGTPDAGPAAGTPDAGPAAGTPDAEPAAGTPDAEPNAGAARSKSGSGFPADWAPQVVDTRRYRWMLGVFALFLVVVISIYQFATNGVGTTGVPAGKRLPVFSAPLANTDLNGVPNPNPPCTLAGHDPRILNLCLLVRRGPVVLSLFAAGSSQCQRQVDALQQLARRYPPSTVQFAAVAVNGTHAATAALIRSHHWTIPVAYDSDGTVGRLYDVVACPMAELADRGGIVKDRLIGDRWRTGAALAPRVAALVNGQSPAG
jgi:peroxiredoxin